MLTTALVVIYWIWDASLAAVLWLNRPAPVVDCCESRLLFQQAVYFPVTLYNKYFVPLQRQQRT